MAKAPATAAPETARVTRLVRSKALRGASSTLGRVTGLSEGVIVLNEALPSLPLPAPTPPPPALPPEEPLRWAPASIWTPLSARWVVPFVLWGAPLCHWRH